MRDRGRAERMLASAMGPALTATLRDPAVVEVMANPDGRLWIDRMDSGRQDTGVRLAPADVERIVRLVASGAGQASGAACPIVSAELPGNGERFEGVLPPVAPAPCFSIRKPSGRILLLEDYVLSGTLGAGFADVLRQAVKSRKNLLVAGGSGTGKTTFANALLAEASRHGDRFVILEDTRELHCEAADWVRLRTRDGSVTLSDLVRSALRLRPDRIIVGEVRGPEALALIKAWNTGHPGGIATLHANSAEAALLRLEQLVQEAGARPDRRLIAEAVDLVVFLRGRGGARRIETLLSVEGVRPDGRYATTATQPSTSSGA